jgi:formylmethanofuran dehydrogenase subunit E
MLWDAPGSDVMTISQTLLFDRAWLPGVMGPAPCAACGELAAGDHVRGLRDKRVCMPCSAYER